ncbi:hypothetical protein QAD02_016522 [Eretmocerus hayati]|uniref:Uncharacterized protein n=1 Tax=Eretmocerus hayati TaxID=131215 RepID=A0ACC2PBE2_9HYME|nr:hypothetical protein QAD02_016522 [Eretmocerus hayati]
MTIIAALQKADMRAKKLWLFGGISVVLLVVVIIAVIWAIRTNHSQQARFISSSPLGVYEKAAVTTNGPECSGVGVDILKRNGSAVDAAIAALLCEGVSSLHSMGLGGGFLMTLYDAPTGETIFLDARETAPGAAKVDMFGGDPEQSLTGGLAVAVPGELLGYYEAHKRYGRLPWKDLFKATIELCETGSIVTKYHEDSFKGKERYIVEEPSLSEILIDPGTKKLYKEGDRVKRPKLAHTLRKLAEYGADGSVQEFYNGIMAKDLVKEIRERGGIITEKDFADYRVNITKPLTAKIDKLTILTAPPPGSGALLIFIFNVLKDYVQIEHQGVMWQRLIETFKWAYARRTELGDPNPIFYNDTELYKHYNLDNVLKNLTSTEYADYIRSLIEDDKTYTDFAHYGVNVTNKPDHGTSHVSVLAPDGSAVSVTSTINQVFGAKFRSNSTGIIFNDEMDDFSAPNSTNAFGIPPSPMNFIAPKKRPLSSMVPTIVLGEDNHVQMVIGAAGGSKITSAVASVMLFNLRHDYDIKEAIDARRLHHQLSPMTIQNEKNFDEDVLKYLLEIGHNKTTYRGIGSAVTGISRVGGKITANSDYRRQGTVSGF